MKIKKTELVKIIREELASHIKSLMEAPGDENDEGEPVKTKKPSKTPKAPVPQKVEPNKTDDKPVKAPGKVAPPEKAGSKVDLDKDQEPPEQPIEKDPSDDELEKDSEDEEDVTGGEIAKEVTGKTIQSITMSPKSKIMPGAIEVTLTFAQMPEPLRILVSKSGDVKFYHKGLHNTL